MRSARFIRSLFRCLWSGLWLCATRFARSRRFALFVQLPPLLPLGLPLCVLHVLHVLHIPRDRLWTRIQDDQTAESSGEEESSDEEEEAAEEEEDEEDEEGSDAGSAIKEEEDEPSLAQRAPRTTHLEVACMAAEAQPKGTIVKANSEAKQEPEELSKKKKEKAKSPPEKKSKGKQKVEEKPKHVHYAVEGEPRRKMPTGATRGEKYQAGAACDNDVQVMQRTLAVGIRCLTRTSMPTLQSVFGRGNTGPPRIGPGAASGDRRAGVQCPPMWHKECTKHGRCHRTV